MEHAIAADMALLIKHINTTVMVFQRTVHLLEHDDNKKLHK